MKKRKETPLLIRGIYAEDKERIRKQALMERDATVSAFVRRVLFNYLKEKEEAA